MEHVPKIARATKMNTVDLILTMGLQGIFAPSGNGIALHVELAED